ncbi:MAG: hypothetical protein JRI59_10825 [Deltaproteobacteria bacterium]|nr:hypothetical protein [Deltaproteobacteria bacterium]
MKSVAWHLLVQAQGRPHWQPYNSSFNVSAYQGWDFESFDELSHALWFLLRKSPFKNFSAAEVMIDITGGQKPTSVVAAAITFNRPIKAQYVQTNYPWDVISYDVELPSREPGGIGL